MANRKRAIKVSDVNHCYAPQYEELSQAKILKFAMTFTGVADYFPIKKDQPALPRQVSYFHVERQYYACR